MRNIYFENKAIVICSPDESCMKDSNGIVLYGDNESVLTDILGMIEKAPENTRLYIRSKNQDETYSRICSLFTEINAGGGLVRNSMEEYLLIYRDGIWDLPKGKQEDGEDIKVTAVREVGEECGIVNLSLGELLCITNHTYRREGCFYLKHTYWFCMTENTTETLHPQTEEHISSVKWVPYAELGEYLENTYPSIKEVVSHIL